MSIDFDVSLAPGADPNGDPTLDWDFNTSLTSPACLVRGPIVIVRGRSNEQDSVEPSSCALGIVNDDGMFSPRNPASPLYGQLDRNTPLQVSVNHGGPHIRFTGQVPGFAPRWSGPGIDEHVPVFAEGILRRLGQGNVPIRSLARNAGDFRIASGASVVGYWPLEDAEGSTVAASAIPGGSPLTQELVTFGTVTPPAGSAAAPNVSGGILAGACLAAPFPGAWTVTLFFQALASDACRVIEWFTSTGLSFLLDINITTAGTATLTPSSGSAATLAVDLADGAWHAVNILAGDSGPFAFVDMYVDNQAPASGSATGSVGIVTDVVLNPFADSELTSVNHLFVSGVASIPFGKTVMDGQPGNPAGSNFSTLADYNIVPVDVSASDLTDTELMGPLPTGTILAALEECADADEGILTERLDGRLGYDSRAGRYNLPVALTLDYDQGHIQDGFEPSEDDLLTRNYIVVTRSGGSSSTVTEPDGPLGTERAGTYEDRATRNLYTDAQTLPHAQWRLRLGTTDAVRVPTVTVDLYANPDLIDDWLDCDIGSRIQILNVPTKFVGGGPLDLIIEGYTETLDAEVWTIDLNCAPYEPFAVGSYQDAGVVASDRPTRYDGEFSTTNGGYVSGPGSLSVATSSGPLWSTTAPMPMLVRARGITLTVSAISGAASPQTFTVTEADVPGVTIPSGSEVHVVDRGYYALGG